MREYVGFVCVNVPVKRCMYVCVRTCVHVCAREIDGRQSIVTDTTSTSASQLGPSYVNVIALAVVM